MNKFRSRKFLTMVVTNIIMVIFAALAIQLSPDQMDGVEKLAAILVPLIIGGLNSRGYIAVEGRNDSLDLARKIAEAQKVGIESVKIEGQ